MFAGTAMALLSEACMVTSGISVATGWWLIRHGRVRSHRRAMLLGSWTGGAFLALYVVHTLVFGDTQFGGPHSWNVPYLTFLQIHSILATVAGIRAEVTAFAPTAANRALTAVRAGTLNGAAVLVRGAGAAETPAAATPPGEGSGDPPKAVSR